MPDDPNEMIHIKHPNVKAFGGPVTRHALDEVWRHKGWEAASADEVARSGEKARLDDLTGASDDAAPAATAAGKK
jgi:hypothetical protein